MKKINIEILTTTGCSKCLKAKETIKKILDEFGDQIEYKETNVTEEPDKLIQFGVMSTPSIIINNELAFEGPPSEEDLREKIKSLIDQSK